MKSFFYLADDIKTENNGKHILLGLYPDHVVNVKVPQELPDIDPSGKPVGLLIDQLTIGICVAGVVGTFHSSFEIFSPGKTKVAEGELHEFKLEPGQSHTLILNFRPFPMLEGGEYEIQMSINTDKLYFPFTINKVRD